MTFALLTAYDKNVEEYAHFSITNKTNYTKKYNIPFIIETKMFPPDGAMWGKLLIITRYLPLYDWIFWTDADSLIMNSNIKLEPPTNKEDLYLSYDRYTLNAGNFWIRNCPWSYSFLMRAYCCRNAWFASDNGALMQLMENSQVDMEHVKVVSQRLFNSYLCNNTFHAGDFMLHFAGQPNKKNLMEEWSKKSKW